MRKRALPPLLCLCAVFVWAQAQSYLTAQDNAAAISAEAKRDKVTAFVDVDIIPMDRERVLCCATTRR